MEEEERWQDCKGSSWEAEGNLQHHFLIWISGVFLQSSLFEFLKNMLFSYLLSIIYLQSDFLFSIELKDIVVQPMEQIFFK